MPPIPFLILIRRNGPPYPEVTRVNLPSSLMIVHSNAFVYSTCLLVLVFRYGYTWNKCIIYFSLFPLKPFFIVFQNISHLFVYTHLYAKRYKIYKQIFEKLSTVKASFAHRLSLLGPFNRESAY